MLFDFSGIVNSEKHRDWKIKADNISFANVLSTESAASKKHYYEMILQGDTQIELLGTENLDNVTVRSHILNFDFKHLVVADFTDGACTTINQFKVQTEDRHFTFTCDDKIIDLVKNGKLSYAITTIIDLESDSNLDDKTEESLILGEFLSLMNGTYLGIPMMEYHQGENTVGYKIYDCPKNKYSNNFQAVPHNRIAVGIKKAIAENFNKYKELRNSLGLNRFVELYCELSGTIITEIRLSIMLLSYEYLLTKYLIEIAGEDEGKVQDWSIQSKLGTINKYLRFIKGDAPKILRKDIRNPLFHQGYIPYTSEKELWGYFTKYRNLLVKIFLKILDYTGELELLIENEQ